MTVCKHSFKEHFFPPSANRINLRRVDVEDVEGGCNRARSSSTRQAPTLNEDLPAEQEQQRHPLVLAVDGRHCSKDEESGRNQGDHLRSKRKRVKEILDEHSPSSAISHKKHAEDQRGQFDGSRNSVVHEQRACEEDAARTGLIGEGNDHTYKEVPFRS